MEETKKLLKLSGFSDKAIDYYERKLNVGEIENPDAYYVYTGPCGDTVGVFLKVSSNVVKDAKFMAIGCAGSFTCGSALCEMIKGKTLEEAKDIDERNIYDHLDGIPELKFDCATLVKTTLGKAIEQYRKNKA